MKTVSIIAGTTEFCPAVVGSFAAGADVIADPPPAVLFAIVSLDVSPLVGGTVAALLPVDASVGAVVVLPAAIPD